MLVSSRCYAGEIVLRSQVHQKHSILAIIVMYYYKYQKPGNLEFNMLRRGEIFFASPDELNDGSECRPRFVLRGSAGLWVRLSHFILQETWFRLGYHERGTKSETDQLFGLASPLGKGLKRRARNKELGIEDLATLFCEHLRGPLDTVFAAV